MNKIIIRVIKKPKFNWDNPHATVWIRNGTSKRKVSPISYHGKVERFLVRAPLDMDCSLPTYHVPCSMQKYCVLYPTQLTDVHRRKLSSLLFEVCKIYNATSEEWSTNKRSLLIKLDRLVTSANSIALNGNIIGYFLLIRLFRDPLMMSYESLFSLLLKRSLTLVSLPPLLHHSILQMHSKSVHFPPWIYLVLLDRLFRSGTLLEESRKAAATCLLVLVTQGVSVQSHYFLSLAKLIPASMVHEDHKLFHWCLSHAALNLPYCPLESLQGYVIQIYRIGVSYLLETIMHCKKWQCQSKVLIKRLFQALLRMKPRNRPILDFECIHLMKKVFGILGCSWLFMQKIAHLLCFTETFLCEQSKKDFILHLLLHCDKSLPLSLKEELMLNLSDTSSHYLNVGRLLRKCHLTLNSEDFNAQEREIYTRNNFTQLKDAIAKIDEFSLEFYEICLKSFWSLTLQRHVKIPLDMWDPIKTLIPLNGSTSTSFWTQLWTHYVSLEPNLFSFTFAVIVDEFSLQFSIVDKKWFSSLKLRDFLRLILTTLTDKSPANELEKSIQKWIVKMALKCPDLFQCAMTVKEIQSSPEMQRIKQLAATLDAPSVLLSPHACSPPSLNGGLEWQTERDCMVRFVTKLLHPWSTAMMHSAKTEHYHL